MSQISAPFNVQKGGASNSPLVRIDAKARANVPGWATASIVQKAKAVFDAFIEVFRENQWHYAAGSFPGLVTLDILLGQQTMQQLEAKFNVAPTMDCGRIRNLLAVTFQSLLPVRVGDARVEGLFITKKLGTPPTGAQGEFACIDKTVYGNVRSTKVAYQEINQCIFEDHYAVKLLETGLVYDGCLTAIYPSIDCVVEDLLKKSPANPDELISRTPPPPGGAMPLTWKLMKGETPNGFSAGYMLL
jgi:hypothetical protein